MKSPNLFSVKTNPDIIPDNIKDFANFGASVLSIMSNFSMEDEYLIDNICKLIISNKYKAVTNEWKKITGSFS